MLAYIPYMDPMGIQDHRVFMYSCMPKISKQDPAWPVVK